MFSRFLRFFPFAPGRPSAPILSRVQKNQRNVHVRLYDAESRGVPFVGTQPTLQDRPTSTTATLTWPLHTPHQDTDMHVTSRQVVLLSHIHAGQDQSHEPCRFNHSSFIIDSVDFDARRFRNGRAFGSADSLRPLHGTGNHPELPCTFSYPSSPPLNEKQMRVNFILIWSIEFFLQQAVVLCLVAQCVFQGWCGRVGSKLKG